MSGCRTKLQPLVGAILASLVPLGPSASLAAPVNYGDSPGTNVDFLQVTEKT